jgi:hypothetical protein
MVVGTFVPSERGARCIVSRAGRAAGAVFLKRRAILFNRLA